MFILFVSTTYLLLSQVKVKDNNLDAIIARFLKIEKIIYRKALDIEKIYPCAIISINIKKGRVCLVKNVQ